MGPICVNEKLKPHLPKHSFTDEDFSYSVSSSPFGSASILLISYIYMKLMAANGLLKASQVQFYLPTIWLRDLKMIIAFYIAVRAD